MSGQQSTSKAFTDGNYVENYFFHPRYIFASRPRIAWAVKKIPESAGGILNRAIQIPNRGPGPKNKIIEFIQFQYCFPSPDNK